MKSLYITWRKQWDGSWSCKDSDSFLRILDEEVEHVLNEVEPPVDDNPKEEPEVKLEPSLEESVKDEDGVREEDVQVKNENVQVKEEPSPDEDAK